ncbi:hypothetical protein chiPu_0024852, partial [Chiloscyllium punctatum]|nr:hypothetical protein [Chiloscyllium punctatum]
MAASEGGARCNDITSADGWWACPAPPPPPNLPTSRAPLQWEAEGGVEASQPEGRRAGRPMGWKGVACADQWEGGPVRVGWGCWQPEPLSRSGAAGGSGHPEAGGKRRLITSWRRAEFPL